MTNKNSKEKLLTRWRFLAIGQFLILSIFGLIMFFNRPNYEIKISTPPIIHPLEEIQDVDGLKYFIVITSSTFPYSYETARVDIVADKLIIEFGYKKSLIPDIFSSRSQSSFNKYGTRAWENAFALEISDQINLVVDKSSGKILWTREKQR